MEQDLVRLLPLIPDLRNEAKKIKKLRGSTLPDDDLVDRFLVMHARAVLKRFDPSIGEFWHYIRSSFWYFANSAIAEEHRAIRRSVPESQFTNGELGSFQVELMDGRPDSDPSQIALATERCSAVNEALQMLSAKEQFLVALRYHGGLSMRQIAKLVELPSAGAAQKAVERAAEKLRPRLKEFSTP